MKPIQTTGNACHCGFSFRRRLLPAAILAAGQALFVGSAQAGPEGGRVVGGQGNIAEGDRITTVTQATDRLAVDWDSFDIDSDEIVNYIQPGSDSIALNRVLSQRGSEIHGQINANGRVVLVNPHGMVFGTDAQINVGGMIASGLSVDTSDFMNGDFTFAALEGTEGAVINRGVIQAATGGSVGLLGRSVKNEGIISAELGAVNLAAGKEAVVTFDDSGLMGVRVSKAIMQEELGVDPALINEGKINAAGGRVLLTASTSQNIFSQAVNTGDVGHSDSVVLHDDGSFTLGAGADVVNTGTLNVSSTSNGAGRVAVLGENVTHSGLVQADSQFSHNGIRGEVELHAQDKTLVTQYGRISAQNQTGQGGNIAVLGQRVGLTDYASLNASGASGGGQILVGGGYKGQNTTIRNSQRTYLGPEAALQANALVDGDGGRVIVWADEITRYAGHLEAKGAGADGVGGFAEVSGKEVLDFKGTASLSGPGGSGTLLLDPRDIRIVGLGQGGNDGDIPPAEEGSATVDFEDMFGDPQEADASFSYNTISNLLNSDTNVVLKATRDIEIAAGFATNDNNLNSLTLEAGDDIQVNANIDLGGGAISLTAGIADCGTPGCAPDSENLAGEDAVDLGGRSVSLNGTLNTTGTIDIRAADNIEVNDAIGNTLSPSLVSLRAGSSITVSPSSFENTIQLASLSEASQGNPSLILKAGDASLAGDLANASVGPDFSKDLIIEGAMHTGGASVFLNAGGTVDLDANVTTLGGHFDVGDANTQSGGYRPNGFIHNGGTINTGFGTQTMMVNGSEEQLTVVGDVRIHTVAADDSSGAGDVKLGSVDLGYDSGVVESDGGSGRTGSIIVDAAGDFTLASAFDFNDSASRLWDGTSLNLDSADEVAFDVTAGGDITLDAAIYDSYGDQRDALEVFLNAGGTVTLNNVLYTAGGNVEITGQSIDFGINGVLDTGRAYDDDQNGTNGTEIGGWSNGSNLFINTVAGGTLGSITTRNSCEDGACSGNLIFDRPDEAMGAYSLTQTTGTALNISGSTTVDVGAGTVSLNNGGNHFEDDWTLNSAGAISVRDDGDIRFGVGSGVGPISVNTTGDNEENGGDITFRPLDANDESFTLNLGELVANGGDVEGDENDDAGNGGFIDAEAPTIVLHGSVTSLGGEESTSGWSQDGYSGRVALTGDVKIADAVVVDVSPKDDTNDNPPTGAGNFTVTGTLDALDTTATDLTVNAADIEITQTVGATQALGTVVFNTYGKVTLGGDALPTTAGMTINGQTANNELQAPNTSSLWTLTNSGAGSVTPDSNGSGGTVNFTGMKTLRASDSANRFELALSPAAISDSNGAITFRLFGGSGEDTLVGGDIDNTWALDTNGDFELNENLLFENIETLIGGGDTDTFAFDGNTAFSGAIDGGGGTDNEVDFSEYESSVTVRFGEGDSDWDLSNIQVITGNYDTTLALSRGTNTWTLSGSDSGQVTTAVPDSAPDTETPLFDGTLRFSSVDTLLGGSGEDTFEATGNDVFAGTFNGNGATNTLDLSEFTGDPVTLILGGYTDGWDFSNIQDFVGNDNATLGITRGINTWTLNEAQGGTLSHNANGGTVAITGDVTFKDFGTLRGGSGADAFTVSADYSGTLEGGGGNSNHLTAETSGNEWTLDEAFGGSLTLGSTVDITFSEMQELTGSGTDTLQARDDQNNRWSDAGNGAWHLAENESGPNDQVLFRGMANWVGGDDNDTFELGTRRDVTSIDGGGSSNESNVITASGASAWEHRGGLSGTLDVNTEFSAIHTIEASGGGHSLSSTVADNLWRLTGAGAGNLGTSNGDDSPRLHFSGITTLNGGGATDVFEVTQGAGFDGTLNGTAGHNTLTMQDANGDWQLSGLGAGEVTAGASDILFTGIDAMEGENGGHDLTGPELALTWNLTDSGRGYLHLESDTTARMTFSGMDNLTGGGESDTFQAAQRENGSGTMVWITPEELAGFGVLDAGAGVDQQLLLSDLSGDALDFSLGNHADSDLLIRGFDTLEAHAADNILRGRSDTAYDWQVTGDNAGNVRWGDATPRSSLSFSNIASLYGGDRTDRFEVVNEASLSGVINGEGGLNVLDLSGLEKDITINIGQTDGLGVGFAVLNINGVIGNYNPDDPDSYNSTFNVSADGEAGNVYDWQLETLDTLSDLLASDGVNDGRYRPDTDQEVAFVDFNILEGSEGHDTFTFEGNARVTGRIDGRGGDNIYDADQASGAHHLTLNPSDDSNTRTLVENVHTLRVNGNTDSSLRANDLPLNLWTIDRVQGGGLNDQIDFDGFGHLIGGSAEDVFTLQGDGRMGRIEGGGSLTGNTVKLENLTGSQWVSLDILNESADLRLSAIGDVTATGDPEHTFEADNEANTWAIAGQNAGTLNGDVTFSGFATLLGNEARDDFILTGTSQSTQVTGSLNGGGGDGENTLNLSGFESVLSLNSFESVMNPATAERVSADLVMVAFDELIAPTNAGHRLIGSDDGDLWKITSENGGELGKLSFSGVSDLLGGNGDDRFEYGVNGSLAGHLDGGGRDNENVLDLSALTTTTVSFGEGGDFFNIDRLKGALTKTTLQGLGDDLRWLLDKGENAGSVTHDGQTLNFTQVTDLQGGDGGNRFELDGGWVTGRISGGDQSDEFYVSVASGVQGGVELDGAGGDNNTLRVTGGGSGYLAEYGYQVPTDPDEPPLERLTYTSAGQAVYELTYQGLDQVQDNLTADELRVGGTLDPDTLRLTDQGYHVDGFTLLNYANKTNLTVSGASDDQLIIEGALDIAGTLTLKGAQVSQSNADATIRARHLKLEGIDQLGTSAQPIYSGVDQLSAEVGLGGLFLRNENALRLNSMNSRGAVSISAAGTIESNAALTVAETLDLRSERAGIRLTGQNRFSQSVSLSAAGDVVVHHGRALTLGEVTARELTLDVAGDIDGQGAVHAERVYLDADGQVLFEHENNAAGQLSVTRAEQVTWRNGTAMTVRELDSEGAVTLQAAGLTMAGQLSADSAELDSRDGLLRVDSALTTWGGDLSLSGEDVELGATITSAGALTTNAGGRLVQNSRLQADGDITLSADGNLSMGRLAHTETNGTPISYRAGGDLTLAHLESVDERVSLRAGGRIESALAEDVNNITARRLEVASGRGVGDGQRLFTQVGELSLTNTTGRVALTNTGTLRVERMASNGNISLRNLNGDVELDGRNGPVFNRQEPNAVDAGGTVNANYEEGSLSIILNNGDLLALGAPNTQQPDLVGRRGTIVVVGDIGTPTRPLVMYFKDNLFIEGIRSWSPMWGFGERPATVDNRSSVQLSDFDLLTSGGEYLVELEELEDVDPALFTAVRNYTYDDVSIRLPESQLYE